MNLTDHVLGWKLIGDGVAFKVFDGLERGPRLPASARFVQPS